MTAHTGVKWGCLAGSLALLAGCSSSSSPGTTSTGSSTSAATSAGSTATTSTGGAGSTSSATTAGSAGTDGTASSSGSSASSGSSGATSSGSSSTTGGGPGLVGDGIAWTFTGTNYVAQNNLKGSVGPTYEYASVDATTDTAASPTHEFAITSIPAKVGKVDCSALPASASDKVTWIDRTPGNMPFQKLFVSRPTVAPCSYDVTKADLTTGGDFQGTFTVDLHFAGVPGLYPVEDRSVTGTFHLTSR